MSISSLPSSSVFGAIVIVDPIVVSDDEFNALYSPLGTDLSSSTVSVQAAELSHYCYDEVWISVGKISDPTFPVRNMQRGSVKTLVLSIEALRFDHLNEMIIAA